MCTLTPTSDICVRIFIRFSCAHCHSVLRTLGAQCSQDAWYGVGNFYSNNGSSPDAPDNFWLNNFNNIFRSYGNEHCWRLREGRGWVGGALWWPDLENFLQRNVPVFVSVPITQKIFSSWKYFDKFEKSLTNLKWFIKILSIQIYTLNLHKFFYDTDYYKAHASFCLSCWLFKFLKIFFDVFFLLSEFIMWYVLVVSSDIVWADGD